MISRITIFGLAFVASAAWASVRFPTDGKVANNVQQQDVATQVKLPLSIQIQAVAQVVAGRIYLQDIGKCTGAEFACTEVMAIDIASSAQPGKTMRLSTDRVRHLVDQEFAQHEITVEGPTVVRVQSKHIEIGSKEIEEALLSGITSRLEETKDIRLRSLNVQIPREIKAWPGSYSLEFPKLHAAQMQHLDWIVEHLLGDKSWTVVYVPENFGANRSSTERITVHLELEIQQPVARAHIARGSLLKHEDFEYKWLRLGRHSQGLITEIKSVVGLLTKQAVRSGQPLAYRMLEVPEVVARGEKVRMLIKKSGLNISAEGKALRSGGIGQSVAVYYPATKKTVQGKIIASGLVEVQL